RVGEREIFVVVPVYDLSCPLNICWGYPYQGRTALIDVMEELGGDPAIQAGKQECMGFYQDKACREQSGTGSRQTGEDRLSLRM
ncbi:MAG: hypothetical protein Q8R28_03940, partial [Dehalococcoidia bacterium]|nr:hypothetical protein [Dehalococcoidia bacterium]